MSHKKSSVLFVSVALFCLMVVVVSFHIPVHAQSVSTGKDNCVSCHEDLYLLHDTGNWFCLRESPMSCVDCHGGNPEAVTQETAHLHRATHPIVNEDTSKCRECHPAEYDKRVEMFDQRAGISQIRVAAPYSPAHPANTTSLIASTGQTEEQSGGLPVLWITTLLIVIASLTLITFIIHHTFRKEHNQ